MSNLDMPDDSTGCPHQRRKRRRRDFLEAIQQSQVVPPFQLVDVGQRLREIRMNRNFTIRDLAKKSGLNVNTLSMIENGRTSPSLETLQQLSLAIETPLATFFQENTPNNEIAFFKSKQRASINFSNGSLEDLGAGMPRRGAETYLVTLDPLSRSGDNFIVHTGRETVFCLEGQLTYTIEDKTYILEPGDSLFFEAHLPHRWENSGTTPTSSFLVLCPSDDQDQATERHFVTGVKQSQ